MEKFSIVEQLTADFLDPMPAVFAFSDPAKSTMCNFPKCCTVSSPFLTIVCTLTVKIQWDLLECLFIFVSPIFFDCTALCIKFSTSSDDNTSFSTSPLLYLCIKKMSKEKQKNRLSDALILTHLPTKRPGFLIHNFQLGCRASFS